MSWHPKLAELLVRHVWADGRRTLESWNPVTGNRVFVAEVNPGSWLVPGSTWLTAHPNGRSNTVVLVDVRDLSAPVIVDVPSTERPSFASRSASPDGQWLLLHHYENGKPWTDVVDLRGTPPWPRRELVRPGPTGMSPLEAWSPSGRIVLLSDDEEFWVSERIAWFDLESGASHSMQLTKGRSPSPELRWSWRGRIAPDERTLLIVQGETLAVWPLGGPMSAAVRLDGIPRWSNHAWRPPARGR